MEKNIIFYRIRNRYNGKKNIPEPGKLITVFCDITNREQYENLYTKW